MNLAGLAAIKAKLEYRCHAINVKAGAAAPKTSAGISGRKASKAG